MPRFRAADAAAALLQLNHANAIIAREPFQNLLRVVSAAIIDDNELPATQRLRAHALDRVTDGLRAIVCWQYHRHEQRRGLLLRRQMGVSDQQQLLQADLCLG
jgi:hypothetical protein